MEWMKRMSSTSPDAIVGRVYPEAAAPAARSAPTQPSRPRPRRLAGVARRAAAPLLLLTAWQLASSVGWLDASTLASPADVWEAFTASLSSGELVPSILTSLRRVVVGLAI